MIKNISKRLRIAGAGGVIFGDVVYEAGGSFGPRVQADYQLVVIREGEARVRVDGVNEVRIAAGEAGLFRPGRKEFFAFAAKRRTHHSWCAVRPDLVDAALTAACAKVASVQMTSHRFAQLMELGLGLPVAAQREAPQLVETLGLAALREFVFSGGRESVGEHPDALVKLLEWLGLHAPERVDLATLAGVSGVSPSQLVKLCKMHLGVTPIRALWEARTRQGVRMLRDTGLTVGEVAFRCGFQTPFHFSRWVKATTGKSPRGVRTDAWGQKRGK